jgi:hypothetical protein
VCFVVRKTTSELERVILTTLYHASAKNTDSWRTRKGDLQHAFPLDILVVPLSVLVVFADGEHLMCGGFSLSEPIRHGSFEFIANYFDSLSLSPKMNDSGTTFMGSIHSGPPSPWWAMKEDSVEEFHTASSEEGALASPLLGGMAQGLCLLLSQQNHGWRTLCLRAPVTRSNTDLPFEQRHTSQEGQRVQARAQ